jgi:hypothetical protein
VLHWASFSAWHSGSPLSRLARPHGTGWAGLTGPTGHSHDARAQRVATRHGVRADAHWVAAAVNSLAAIRATRQCNSGVWTMEAQGTHRAAPLRSGANEKTGRWRGRHLNGACHIPGGEEGRGGGKGLIRVLARGGKHQRCEVELEPAEREKSGVRWSFSP